MNMRGKKCKCGHPMGWHAKQDRKRALAAKRAKAKREEAVRKAAKGKTAESAMVDAKKKAKAVEVAKKEMQDAVTALRMAQEKLVRAARASIKAGNIAKHFKVSK